MTRNKSLAGWRGRGKRRKGVSGTSVDVSEYNHSYDKCVVLSVTIRTWTRMCQWYMQAENGSSFYIQPSLCWLKREIIRGKGILEKLREKPRGRLVASSQRSECHLIVDETNRSSLVICHLGMFSVVQPSWDIHDFDTLRYQGRRGQTHIP